MAYAHVRCASQHKLSEPTISPDYYSGKAFDAVKGAIKFLKLSKSLTNHLAEIILCPNNHILRVSSEKTTQTIRCPKCKWEKKIWMHKKDHLESLIKEGINQFNLERFNEALEDFRDAQKLDKSQSLAFCWASRCLKKLGRKQDAIRELQKFLSIHPNDEMAQSEMKKLIYD